MNSEGQPTVTVSLSRKVNLGGYESADAFVSISGLPLGTTVEEIDALLDVGALAWNQMRPRLAAKCRELREGRGEVAPASPANGTSGQTKPASTSGKISEGSPSSWPPVETSTVSPKTPALASRS